MSKMDAKTQTMSGQLLEIAERIREMRRVSGFSEEEMAKKTDTSLAEYRQYEAGALDFPFTFIHKCAIAFGISIADILEGESPKLSSYMVTRKGEGQQTAREDGISIQNLAPLFRGKLAEPYWVRYEYSEELQHRPIHLTTHSGQEFDIVLSGKLKVQVGSNTEILNEGDSIFYDSSTPHGMIAVDGQDCCFCAVVIPGESTPEREIRDSVVSARRVEKLVCSKFIETVEDENGTPLEIRYKDQEHFNFAFDIVDEIAAKYPDKTAMVHLDRDKNERRFTFADMKRASSQCANYFKSLGIRKGDRVMLVLKRHYAFWFAILGLHKLGAIAVPATNLLKDHDFVYRFNAAGISAILCTADGDVAEQVELAERELQFVLRQIHTRRGCVVRIGYDADVLYLRYDWISENCRAQLYVSLGAFRYGKILAFGGFRRPALYHFRYGLGKGALGQALRTVALRGRGVYL